MITLKTVRESMKVTQGQFAELTGMTREGVNIAERKGQVMERKHWLAILPALKAARRYKDHEKRLEYLAEMVETAKNEI